MVQWHQQKTGFYISSILCTQSSCFIRQGSHLLSHGWWEGYQKSHRVGWKAFRGIRWYWNLSRQWHGSSGNRSFGVSSCLSEWSLEAFWIEGPSRKEQDNLLQQCLLKLHNHDVGCQPLHAIATFVISPFLEAWVLIFNPPMSQILTNLQIPCWKFTLFWMHAIC